MFREVTAAPTVPARAAPELPRPHNPPKALARPLRVLHLIRSLDTVFGGPAEGVRQTLRLAQAEAPRLAVEEGEQRALVLMQGAHDETPAGESMERILLGRRSSVQSDRRATLIS